MRKPTMRALVNLKAGGPEVLVIQERPDPLPQRGEVLIKVRRSGLNFADISARVGLYPDAPKFPMVMGYEVSGQVDALGAEVSGLAKGDRVLALCRFGGQADTVCVPQAQVHRIADAFSYDEAAALPVNGLTAFHMLFWVAPIQPGMTVLIHSAAGGVGQMAIQLCRTVPNVTIIGTASAWKHQFLQEHGVHHCIDPRTSDYVREVRAITHNRGVDRVLDALGGPDWSRGYELLSPGGHLHCFGWANMVGGEQRNLITLVKQFVQLRRYSPMNLMDKNRGVSGTNMGRMWSETDLMRQHLEKLLAWVAQGQLKPRVDRVFPLEKAADAHRYLQARKNIGKVLLDCERI